MAAIFPWAPRRERQAAIDAARMEKERSRAGKEHAQAVEQQIRHLAADNHYAATIADGIIQGYRRRDGRRK